MAKAVPDEYRGITPYLICRDAHAAIGYYTAAFGARELYRLPMPDGKVGHAELEMAGGRFMLADEFPERGIRSPLGDGRTPVSLLIYVEDVDTVFARAVAAGATVERAVEDQFYGDRTGRLIDPFGHVWTVATHKEDVSGPEMARRMASLPT